MSPEPPSASQPLEQDRHPTMPIPACSQPVTITEALGRLLSNRQISHSDQGFPYTVVYGTHDEGRRLALYGFSDSDLGADLDDRKSTGAYVFSSTEPAVRGRSS